MPKLTDDDLRAIRARAEAATPGPWTVEHEMKYDVNESTAYLSELHLAGKQETVKIYCGPGHAAPQVYDLVFLAYARADIPALLAHADALAAENDALREDHSRLQVVLWTLLNELSPGVVEELRAVWGNANTRILEDRIEDARRTLGRALEGGADTDTEKELPRRCPKCNHPMQYYKWPAIHEGTGEHLGDFRAWECGVCGHQEDD